MLLPPNLRVKDYKIVPANEVGDYLHQGFTPFGTPIGSGSVFYQAMIKTERGSAFNEQKANDNKPVLKKIEQQCLVLLAKGKTPAEISQQIHRSTRRVRTIIIELRNRLGYKNNAQMLLELERLALL